MCKRSSTCPHGVHAQIEEDSFRETKAVLLLTELEKFDPATFLPVAVKHAVPAIRDVVRSGVEPPKEKNLSREKVDDSQDGSPEPR